MKKFFYTLAIGFMMLPLAVSGQNAGGLFPELGRSDTTNPVKKMESKDAGLIKIIIDNIKILNPPLNSVPLCRAELTAQNNTNVTIERLNLGITYGSLKVPVQFGGVQAFGEQSVTIAFAGSNCKSLLNVASVAVEECVAGPMSIGECQSKIKYVPIKGAK